MSVDEIVNECLAQPVETVEDGNSDQDQVSDKPASPPLRNEIDEAIEILNRLTLFTTNLDLDTLLTSESLKQNKSKKTGQNETIFY